MTLVGGILMAFFTGNLVAELLRRSHVAGFHTADGAGYVLLATLSFHGAALLGGLLFLRFTSISLREIAGLDHTRWQRQLVLVFLTLLVALPAMFTLKLSSELVMGWLGLPVEDQRAVDLLLNCHSSRLKIYLGFFAVVIAPIAEEFIFRGLLYSGLKKLGWPKCAWLVTSVLFAAIHGSLPIFLPLVAFALALTWLYEKTEGLLAPVLAHSAFNAANLALLVIAEKFELIHK
jgi:membrane protease YdiL (CAAX protease family)